MNHHKKLTSQQQAEEQQQTAGQHLASTPAPLEFENVEKLLRHDALHTPVPPAIALRLQKSVEENSLSGRPWWRRWLGS